MKVFKFGGASVKDGDSVKNVLKILENNTFNDTLIVISAMGKMTNALEEVINAYFEKGDFYEKISFVKNFHLKVADDLFPKNHLVYSYIDREINKLILFLEENKSSNYNFIYDQIICLGELISTKIVSEYLNFQGLKNKWLDVRDYIKSDNTYREAKIDWSQTLEKVKKIKKDELIITQGFICSDENGLTVTLGREGSDYSAAILSYCLDADSLTVWKDVPGIMNANPTLFEDAQLLETISYEEAIELFFYGATVIHPKTIQPLLRKEIPLYVKSFISPEHRGTHIQKGLNLSPKVTCYTCKEREIFLKISSKDFSFMQEKYISYVFDKLVEFNIKVDMIGLSAITLSLCLEDKFFAIDKFVNKLKDIFDIYILKKM